MGTNPNVPQGTLNKVRGTVIVPTNTALNVTAPYLGTEGITFTPTGRSAILLPTLTGTAVSQQPYMMMSGLIHLLRTQNLSNVYKQQMELDARIGNITVRPDSSKLSPYLYRNCIIAGVQELKFNGTDAGFGIEIEGFYLVNSSMWDQAPG